MLDAERKQMPQVGLPLSRSQGDGKAMDEEKHHS
jgi:hypothetical protein